MSGDDIDLVVCSYNKNMGDVLLCITFFLNWFYPLIASSLIRLLIPFLLCQALIIENNKVEKYKFHFYKRFIVVRMV